MLQWLQQPMQPAGQYPAHWQAYQQPQQQQYHSHQLDGMQQQLTHLLAPPWNELQRRRLEDGAVDDARVIAEQEAADRRHQRDRQDISQIMAVGRRCRRFSRIGCICHFTYLPMGLSPGPSS